MTNVHVLDIVLIQECCIGRCPATDDSRPIIHLRLATPGHSGLPRWWPGNTASCHLTWQPRPGAQDTVDMSTDDLKHNEKRMWARQHHIHLAVNIDDQFRDLFLVSKLYLKIIVDILSYQSVITVDFPRFGWLEIAMVHKLNLWSIHVNPPPVQQSQISVIMSTVQYVVFRKGKSKPSSSYT